MTPALMSLRQLGPGRGVGRGAQPAAATTMPARALPSLKSRQLEAGPEAREPDAGLVASMAAFDIPAARWPRTSAPCATCDVSLHHPAAWTAKPAPPRPGSRAPNARCQAPSACAAAPPGPARPGARAPAAAALPTGLRARPTWPGVQPASLQAGYSPASRARPGSCRPRCHHA